MLSSRSPKSLPFPSSFFFLRKAADEKGAQSDMNCLCESVDAAWGGEMRERDDNLNCDSSFKK